MTAKVEIALADLQILTYNTFFNHSAFFCVVQLDIFKCQQNQMQASVKRQNLTN